VLFLGKELLRVRTTPASAASHCNRTAFAMSKGKHRRKKHRKEESYKIKERKKKRKWW
jgi:hypothetical protein